MSLTGTLSLARARCFRAVCYYRSPGSLAFRTSAHHLRQPSRGFRFGRLWSSYWDPDFYRDICSRYQGFQYNKFDNITRPSSWEKHDLNENTRVGVKQKVEGYWYPGVRVGQSSSFQTSSHSDYQTPDNPEGVRPGQNIEDAERAPLEHLLFGNKYRHAQNTSSKDVSQGSASSSSSQPSEQGDYIIDPITLKKIFKGAPETAYTSSDTDVEIPVETYKPQFEECRPPVDSDSKKANDDQADTTRSFVADSTHPEQQNPFTIHQTSGRYPPYFAEPHISAEERAYYSRPFRSHEPDGLYAAGAESATESTKSANHDIRSNERGDESSLADLEKHSTKDPAASSVKSPLEDDQSYHEAYGYEDSETPRHAKVKGESAGQEGSSASATQQQSQMDESFKENSAEAKFEPKKDSKSAPSVQTSQEEKSPFRKLVEELMAQVATESNVTSEREARTVASVNNAEDTSAKVSRKPKLTGNYVRDFPEDFSATWTTQLHEDITAGQSAEQSETGRIQPALERITESTSDSTKKTETTPGGADATILPKPTVYKVLVYDPTMQCVHIAETTSTTPDTTTPLSPAEVLLRLSNPAKFFPQFGPLQAQGFEIASGSGDVLIFRKVQKRVSSSDAELSNNHVASTGFVNPIDMTGGSRAYMVAADRFANHSMPAGRVGATVEGEMLSQNDVSEERKNYGSGKTEKKSVPKRLAIGAAWLAGGTYAIGVVSEYFKTGGSEDKGKRSL
ncbi:uncharacterized protein CTHT_0037230 [Thermochaetoides thermophila DSM 1495]|uniref:Serine-threonine rich protein n=1 Tax=Chaetomium thermophilum (strain DSM 1495 / CBS 144.50 / IMI 039719) TaxID=759272 RepID=G0S7W5_CHATD|nr:hypothetical protein CTHT_0037230 [Thermochaetoides thermophila DSM 1495]EGS21852.1 hypothetical protein CTHT_0037230 [Thermochaetoides thermophila DSM 1495]